MDIEYNTLNCFALAGNETCLKNGDGEDEILNNTCHSGQWLLDEHSNTSTGSWNASNWIEETAGGHRQQDHRVPSSEEYFFNHVLGLGGDSLRGFGNLRWDVTLCLLTAWLLVAVCISRGITAVGRILHFTVIFPYFALIMLLIPTVFHDGVSEGLQFYGSFNISVLQSPKLWSDTASQIFFSLGISHGDLMTLASFNRLRNNCVRDSLFVVVINTLTSVLSVLVVYAVLGVTAKRLGRGVDNVRGPGLGLAFVTFPEALLYTPYPMAFSVLFFVMLITLGLDSQFVEVEMLAVALVDEWPALRPRRQWVSAGVCAILFTANLCFCLDGGVRVFALFNHYAFSFSPFAVALLEVVAVGWAFGAERLLNLMRQDMAIPMSAAVRLYWLLTWRYLVPAVLVTLLGITFAFHGRATFTAAGQTVLTFHQWEDDIGLVLMFSPVVLVLLVMVMVIVKQKRSGAPLRDVVSSTADWGAARRVKRGPGRSTEGAQGVMVNDDRSAIPGMYPTKSGDAAHSDISDRSVEHAAPPDLDIELSALYVRGLYKGTLGMSPRNMQTNLSSPLVRVFESHARFQSFPVKFIVNR